MDVHIKLYTITVGRPCLNVLIPLQNICNFMLFPRIETQRKRIYYYSTRDDEKYFSNHLNTKHCTLTNSLAQNEQLFLIVTVVLPEQTTSFTQAHVSLNFLNYVSTFIHYANFTIVGNY